MLTNEIKQRVEAATVTITDKGGRGVLIDGGFVLTVAHCVRCETDGSMAHEDFYLEEIETSVSRFRLDVHAVEPRADVAILGEPDNQQPAVENDVEAFEAWREQVEPLSLSFADYELFERFPIYVYTHEGKWVSGTAKQCAPDAKGLFIEFDDLIKGGTSGSAIVNELGEIVGLVSIAGGTIDPHHAREWEDGMPYQNNECFGPAPRPHLTLPVWAIRQITGETQKLRQAVYEKHLKEYPVDMSKF